jgi:hypothetical protein
MKQGICIDCGYVYVPFENDGGCPACRAAKIRETFKPVNPERTAQALVKRYDIVDPATGDIRGHRWDKPEETIPGSFRVGKTGEITHINWNEESKEADAVKSWYYKQTGQVIAEQTEVPRDCRMPKSTEDQVYQLKRLFRL